MASQVASITHYEIYVLAKNRWTLQMRFRHDQMNAALDEAKTIERTVGLPVKVMRETYFPDSNTCEEASVYISPRTTLAPVASARGIEAVARERSRATPAGTQPVFDGESTGTLVFMLMVIVVVALGIAATATEALNFILDAARQADSSVGDSTRSTLVFGTFAVTFLGVAIPMTVWFIAGAEKRAKARAKRAKAVSRMLPAREPRFSREEIALGRAARGMLWEILTRPFRGSEPDEGQASQPPQQSVAAPPAPPPSEPSRSTEATQEIPAETAAPVTDAVEPEPSPAPDSPPDAAATSEALEKHRITAIRFLGDAVSYLKLSSPRLDAYSRFGVNLILAGALETLARQGGIDDQGRQVLLRETLEMLGNKANIAEAFCAKLDHYMLEPRYLQMVQSGRELMERFMAGEKEALKKLGDVLDTWNKPGAKPPAQRIVTVLFTDIVGSTDLTQTQGDIAAQNLVRRHNGIVRATLSEFDGREIKHTGDGIMASFASTNNAVDAAVTIQRAAAGYSATAPELPLRLRLGINAGEPIEEEDDLFGTTVQLAARLCAAAEPEQILCSNVVRELSAGKGRRFSAQGIHELKGFREPVPLFEIAWRDEPNEEQPLLAPEQTQDDPETVPLAH